MQEAMLLNLSATIRPGNLPAIFAGNGTAPQIPSPHPLACLDALTAFPYNLYGIFLCLAAFGLLTFLLMRMGFDRNGEITDRGRNLNYSTKGTYGTSGL